MARKQSWFKTIVPIASIFAFRMLGLFMLIPIFTVHANKLSNATPILIGIAFGAYGLSQGLLQIPFGMLSDKFGRKPIIFIGLIFFILGSLLGAVSHSIYSMILARFIQGMGAIGSVLIALTSDLTKDSDRTKAMATIGMIIGVSFSLALVISPVISNAYGLSGVFYFTAALAFVGLIVLHFFVPTPICQNFHVDSEAKVRLISSVIHNKQLLILNFSIFCQHLVLTSTFFVLPLILKKESLLSFNFNELYFYLPIMVSAFLLMAPFIILAEKHKKMSMVFLGAVSVLIFSQLILLQAYNNFRLLTVSVLGYFIAFNVLEALLPSLISRKAQIKSKGTAMGVYSTCQFLGIFIGGCSAGFLFPYFSFSGIFIMNTVLTILWFLASTKLDLNLNLSSVVINCNVEGINPNVHQKLQSFPGVQEMYFAREEEAIYLKVNRNQFCLDSFKSFIG